MTVLWIGKGMRFKLLKSVCISSSWTLYDSSFDFSINVIFTLLNVFECPEYGREVTENTPLIVIIIPLCDVFFVVHLTGAKVRRKHFVRCTCYCECAYADPEGTSHAGICLAPRSHIYTTGRSRSQCEREAQIYLLAISLSGAPYVLCACLYRAYLSFNKCPPRRVQKLRSRIPCHNY